MKRVLAVCLSVVLLLSCGYEEPTIEGIVEDVQWQQSRRWPYTIVRFADGRVVRFTGSGAVFQIGKYHIIKYNSGMWIEHVEIVPDSQRDRNKES